MSKYISYEPCYEADGQFCLKIHKSRGTLTLEEIEEAARSFDEDCYLLRLNCMDNTNCSQDFGEEPTAHTVRLYRMEDFEK